MIRAFLADCRDDLGTVLVLAAMVAATFLI